MHQQTSEECIKRSHTYPLFLGRRFLALLRWNCLAVSAPNNEFVIAVGSSQVSLSSISLYLYRYRFSVWCCLWFFRIYNILSLLQLSFGCRLGCDKHLVRVNSHVLLHISVLQFSQLFFVLLLEYFAWSSFRFPKNYYRNVPIVWFYVSNPISV